MKKKNLALIISALLSCVLLATVWAYVAYYQVITIDDTAGEIIAIGLRVQWANGSDMTTIDWGMMYESDTEVRYGIFNNTGNYEIEVTHSLADITPSDMFTSWAIFTNNQSGVLIPAYGDVPFSFTLTTSGAPVTEPPTTFSFDILVNGTATKP